MPDPANCQCLVAVGCNQGDCHGNIRHAVAKMDDLPVTSVIATSELIETAPVGRVRGTFLNGALILQTGLEPDVLMRSLLKIESDAGRDRSVDPGDRPIDLDLLLFGNRILKTALLSVPHPRMSFRRFVLEPAVEIAGDWTHPVLNQTLASLLHRVRNNQNIVLVIVPEDFQTQELDLRTGGGVQWVHTGDLKELESCFAEYVAGPDWLVVVSQVKNFPLQQFEAVKLLISVDICNDCDNEVDSICMFPGPQWRLPRIPAGEIRKFVSTSIQAMA